MPGPLRSGLNYLSESRHPIQPGVIAKRALLASLGDGRGLGRMIGVVGDQLDALGGVAIGNYFATDFNSCPRFFFRRLSEEIPCQWLVEPKVVGEATRDIDVGC